MLDIGKTSTMTNESLPAHMHAVEANAIVVLKNIDAFVGNRGKYTSNLSLLVLSG